jgi:hypothetical protein
VRWKLFPSVGNAVGAAVGDVGASVVGEALGMAVGDLDGVAVGETLGTAVGDPVGETLGAVLGLAVGEPDGVAVGEVLGMVVGEALGLIVGDSDRVAVGLPDGVVVGEPDGAVVGEPDGLDVGEVLGLLVGAVVGGTLGDSVGAENGVGGRVGGVLTWMVPTIKKKCGWQKYGKTPDWLNWTVKFPDDCSGDWKRTPVGSTPGTPLTTLWLDASWSQSHVTVSPISISMLAPEMLKPQLIWWSVVCRRIRLVIFSSVYSLYRGWEPTKASSECAAAGGAARRVRRAVVGANVPYDGSTSAVPATSTGTSTAGEVVRLGWVTNDSGSCPYRVMSPSGRAVSEQSDE